MYLFKLCLLGPALLFGAAAGAQRSQTKTVLLPNKWVVWLRNDAVKTVEEYVAWATSIHEEKDPQGFRGVTRIFDYKYVVRDAREHTPTRGREVCEACQANKGHTVRAQH
jgi:hypothetical protein